MQLQFVNVGDIFEVAGNEKSPYHFLNNRDHVIILQEHDEMFRLNSPWVRVQSLVDDRRQWIKIKHLKSIL